MKRQCAWCGTELAPVEDRSCPASAVSHGICKQCLENLRFQKGVSFQDYIDSISVPVLLVSVTESSRIVTNQVNRKACEVLGKKPADMVQHFAGEVFECAYARLPEGCGKTLHCSGCAIRHAVLETYQTGKPQSMVPATLRYNLTDQGDPATLSISTVKLGDMVVLRVDSMAE